MEKKVLTMPIKEEDVRELKLGDVVYLTGHIFTSRDMGHLRIRQLLEKGEPLPKDFNGAAIFHAGPVCLKNEDGSWRLNVIGPTTSIRMEPYCDMVGKLVSKRSSERAAWKRILWQPVKNMAMFTFRQLLLCCKAGTGYQGYSGCYLV